MNQSSKRNQLSSRVSILSSIVRAAFNPRSVRTVAFFIDLAHTVLAFFVFNSWALCVAGIGLRCLCFLLRPNELSPTSRILRSGSLHFLNVVTAAFITWPDHFGALVNQWTPRISAPWVAILVWLVLTCFDQLANEFHRTYARRELIRDPIKTVKEFANLPFEISKPSVVRVEVNADRTSGQEEPEEPFAAMVVDSNNEVVVELKTRNSLAVRERLFPPGKYYLEITNTRPSGLPIRVRCSASIPVMSTEDDVQPEPEEFLVISALTEDLGAPSNALPPLSLDCPAGARATVSRDEHSDCEVSENCSNTEPADTPVRSESGSAPWPPELHPPEAPPRASGESDLDEEQIKRAKRRH